MNNNSFEGVIVRTLRFISRICKYVIEDVNTFIDIF